MPELRFSGQDLYDLMISVLNDNHNMKIQCRGNSMAPFIKDRNILTLNPAEKNHSFQIGNIVVIAIHDKKRILIHRIVAVTSDKYLVKGDNNSTSDGWFNKKDILGTVKKIKTNTGFEYSPKPWQNLIIALGSKNNIIKKSLLPTIKFFLPKKSPINPSELAVPTVVKN